MTEVGRRASPASLPRGGRVLRMSAGGHQTRRIGQLRGYAPVVALAVAFLAVSALTVPAAAVAAHRRGGGRSSAQARGRGVGHRHGR